MHRSIVTRLLIVASVLLGLGGNATAQNALQALAVTTCGTPGRTITAGSPGPVTINTNGVLCAPGSSGVPTVVNVTQWASGTLGAMANYGTSPGAVLVPGVNAFVTNPVAVTGTFWQATQPVSVAPSSAPGVGITPVVGGSAASSLVLKAGAGNLYSVYAECSAACWLMVFNSTTAPSNGSTTAGVGSGNLVECIPIGAGGGGSISYGSGPPAVYSVGITAAISSTTCATLTLATTGFIHGMVQ